MLLLSVVDFVPVVVVLVVVVVALDVVELTEGVVPGFDVVGDEVQSTLSGQSHCLLDGLNRRPGRIMIV